MLSHGVHVANTSRVSETDEFLASARVTLAGGWGSVLPGLCSLDVLNNGGETFLHEEVHQVDVTIDKTDENFVSNIGLLLLALCLFSCCSSIDLFLNNFEHVELTTFALLEDHWEHKLGENFHHESLSLLLTFISGARGQGNDQIRGGLFLLLSIE